MPENSDQWSATGMSGFILSEIRFGRVDMGSRYINIKNRTKGFYCNFVL